MNDEKNQPQAENEEEIEIITLIDEDGKEMDFEVVGDAEIDGNIYVAVIAVDAQPDKDGFINFTVLKQVEIEDGEYELVSIDDEEEFDKVASYFDQLMDDADEDYDS